MPDHPESKIEKQLRASAEQRRTEAGAPFELHEATRRLLQAAAARQYGRPADLRGGAGWSWLALWPRFAAGTALAALLGVSLWLSLPRSASEKQLAMSEASKEKNLTTAKDQPVASTPARPAKVAAPSTQRAIALEPASTLALGRGGEKKTEAVPQADTSDKLALAAAPLASPAQPAIAPTPVPTRATTPPLEVASVNQQVGRDAQLSQAASPAGRNGFGGFGGGGGGGRTGGRAQPTKVQPGLEGADSAARKDADASATAPDRAATTFADQYATSNLALNTTTEETRARQFAEPGAMYFRNQIAPPAPRSEATTGGRGGRGLAASTPITRAVLNTFVVEQTGDAMRIVDEDGSVYTGKWQAGTEADAAKAKAFDSTQARRAQFAKAAVETKTVEQVQPLPIHFNVTGMNRSLSQQLVFTGQLQQATMLNAVNNQTGALFVATQASVNLPPSNTAFTQSQLAPQLNQQQRVVGRARLADSRELSVDAIATERVPTKQ